jgi:hypothetical protein
MGQLANLASKMSTFLKVRPGETVTALYKGFRVIPNKFDPEKETIQYSLEVDGSKKFWETGSLSVAYFFDGVKEGEIVEIKNVGDERKSKFLLKILVGENSDLYKE